MATSNRMGRMLDLFHWTACGLGGIVLFGNIIRWYLER